MGQKHKQNEKEKPALSEEYYKSQWQVKGMNKKQTGQT